MYRVIDKIVGEIFETKTETKMIEYAYNKVNDYHNSKYYSNIIYFWEDEYTIVIDCS